MRRSRASAAHTRCVVGKKIEMPKRPKAKLAKSLRPVRVSMCLTQDEYARGSVVADRLGLAFSDLLRRMLAGVISADYANGEQLAIVKDRQIVGLLIGL